MQIIFIPLKAGPIAYLSFNESHFFKLHCIFLVYIGLHRASFLNFKPILLKFDWQSKWIYNLFALTSFHFIFSKIQNFSYFDIY